MPNAGLDPGSWQLELRPAARRALRVLPEKAATALVELLNDIEASPYRVGKALRLDLDGRFRARRGSYRVIYSVNNAQRRVVVEDIRDRSAAYGHR